MFTPHKTRRGQVAIIAVLAIALTLVAIFPLLTFLQLRTEATDSDLKTTVSQLSRNFNDALTIALSEVTQQLELKSSTRDYLNYTSLTEYSQAETLGLDFLAEWKNETSLQYYGLGLNLNLSSAEFECEWATTPFHSTATGILEFDIPHYGFEGWTYETVVESNLYILSLNQSEGDYTSFFFRLTRENAVPMNTLQKAHLKIYYYSTDEEFLPVDEAFFQLLPIGDGKYMLKIYAPNISVPPRIKMILQDPRGIIVGAVPTQGVVLTAEEDHVGPLTLNLMYVPSFIYVNDSFTLTGSIDDTETGWSFIASAEYFVNTIGANGTGMPLLAADGVFDSYIEGVEADIDVTGWTMGTHVLYVHGIDAQGNWGNFSEITVEIIEEPRMYVHRIDMSLESEWSWWGRRVRGRATITIYDTEGHAVAGATVSGTWSGATHDTDWGLTDAVGRVTLRSDWVYVSGWARLTFTFTVTNVVKAGWTYDPGLNIETTDTIRYN